MSGNLYIVATPIGNLADISKRAIAILKEVDLIAAEDTRHSKIMLKQFAIKTRTIAYHEYNEEKMSLYLIRQLSAGLSIALISDAGTPLINDPGYKLVAMAHDHNINVIPIPGPSSMITALSASGLPTAKFIFEGYLPVKKEACRARLIQLKNESRTLIFYETPHRLVRSMAIMQDVFGDERRVTIAREMTKRFEQIVRNSLNEIHRKINNKEITIKGEFVILVEGAREMSVSSVSIEEILRINRILSEQLPPKAAANLTAKIVGSKTNEIYQLVLNSDRD